MASVSDLVASATRYLGKPYVFGATGPNSFDCSGLVKRVFADAGITLPRTTFEQVNVGTAVPKDQIKAGDLVFSSWDGTPHSHVGIATGDGRIINAPHSGATVGYATLSPSYLAHVDAVRRVPGVSGQAGGQLLGGSGGSGYTTVGFGFPTPGDLVGAVQDAAGALHDIAGGVVTAGKLADGLLKLMLPSNLLRLVMGILGLGFLLVGIGFLVKEVKT